MRAFALAKQSTPGPGVLETLVIAEERRQVEEQGLHNVNATLQEIGIELDPMEIPPQPDRELYETVRQKRITKVLDEIRQATPWQWEHEQFIKNA
ncbi:MAG: hypothetical protein ACYDHH_18795 [Solirubrobacteraceae bacterium]